MDEMTEGKRSVSGGKGNALKKCKSGNGGKEMHKSIYRMQTQELRNGLTIAGTSNVVEKKHVWAGATNGTYERV